MKINTEPQALPDHFNMEERSVVGQQKIKLSHLSSVERDAGAADHRIIKCLKMPATAAAKQDASQAA